MSLSLALATLAILALIVAFSIVRANAARERRINDAKERTRIRDIKMSAIPVYKPAHTTEPIKYDLSLHGMEVSDDMTESQYAILKAIFDDEHPDRIFLNKDEAVPVIDYWRDTAPMGISK
jgi:hypothetical protein